MCDISITLEVLIPYKFIDFKERQFWNIPDIVVTCSVPEPHPDKSIDVKYSQ